MSDQLSALNLVPYALHPGLPVPLCLCALRLFLVLFQFGCRNHIPSGSLSVNLFFRIHSFRVSAISLALNITGQGGSLHRLAIDLDLAAHQLGVTHLTIISANPVGIIIGIIHHLGEEFIV